MATVEARIYTPDDLLKMPDANNIELVNGELVEKPEIALSSFVEGKIFAKINSHCEATKTHLAFPSSNGIGCFPDEPNEVRKPDVSVFKTNRFTHEHMMEGFVTIAPDLAVEVISTNDEVAELNEKIEDYLGAGVPLVWVIDPENEIAFIHRKDGSVTKLHKNDELSGEIILPGFACKVAELFPQLYLLRRRPAEFFEPLAAVFPFGGIEGERVAMLVGFDSGDNLGPEGNAFGVVNEPNELPGPCRLILTSRQGEFGVGAQGHRKDHVPMLERRSNRLSGGCLPQSRRLIPATREGDFAVGAQGHGTDQTLMLQRWADRLACGRLPQPRLPVIASREGDFAVGTQGHGQDPVLVLQRLPDRLTCGRLPQSRGLVQASRQGDFAVGAQGNGLNPVLMQQGRSHRLAGGRLP